MPKPTLTPAEQVTNHIRGLDPAIREVVEQLRRIILSTDSQIAEQIKWNNPAFYSPTGMVHIRSFACAQDDKRVDLLILPVSCFSFAHPGNTLS